MKSYETSTVAFVTLGCPKNEVDTDLMCSACEVAGYYTTEQIQDADAIVVNTCSFIQEATEASIDAIFDALGTIDDQNTAQAKTPVIVAGCMVNRYSDDLAEQMPEVAAFVKVGDTQELVQALHKVLGKPSPENLSDAKHRAKKVRSYEYLRIADGCNRKCTFCTIPSIRGPYISREPADILNQAQKLLIAGTRELIVIAQDIGRYGKDLAVPTNLINLLNSLAEIPQLKRLRLMYLQPEGLSDELIGVMAKHPAIVPYLEVPLQHVAPRILKAMGRNPKDAGNFEYQLAKARRMMPNLTVRTTLIAGFPGETGEEFDQLCDFIVRNDFDYVGVFPYSPEEGTLAAELPDQLDQEVRIGRAQQIRDLADSIGWERMQRYLDTSLEVLIEGHDAEEQVLLGRSAFQAPDIDGIVRIAATPGESFDDLIAANPPNSMIEVIVQDAILYDLEANIVTDR